MRTVPAQGNTRFPCSHYLSAHRLLLITLNCACFPLDESYSNSATEPTFYELKTLRKRNKRKREIHLGCLQDNSHQPPLQGINNN